ncbi:hypothetical protein XC71_16055, partial [Klebsiella pneumoniae]|nr:hypothetical protein [Klebsiella pneumoniae]
ISSTEVYTKVFALDVAARHRVQFQMPGDEAVALLKGNGREHLSVLTSRHRLGYLCKNNKYDQAKYFLDIYSDSAEMSREKSIFCVSVVYCR